MDQWQSEIQAGFVAEWQLFQDVLVTGIGVRRRKLPGFAKSADSDVVHTSFVKVAPPQTKKLDRVLVQASKHSKAVVIGAALNWVTHYEREERCPRRLAQIRAMQSYFVRERAKVNVDEDSAAAAEQLSKD